MNNYENPAEVFSHSENLPDEGISNLLTLWHNIIYKVTKKHKQILNTVTSRVYNYRPHIWPLGLRLDMLVFYEYSLPSHINLIW